MGQYEPNDSLSSSGVHRILCVLIGLAVLVAVVVAVVAYGIHVTEQDNVSDQRAALIAAFERLDARVRREAQDAFDTHGEFYPGLKYIHMEVEILEDARVQFSRLEQGELDATIVRGELNVLYRYRDRIQAYHDLYDEFEQLGHVEPSTLADVEDINSRISMISDLKIKNHEVLVATESLTNDTYNELIALKVSPSRAYEEARLFAMGTKTDVQRAIRRLDRRMLEHMASMLRDYGYAWGKWTVDKKSGDVLVRDDAILDQFNASIDVLNGFREEGISLQRELFLGTPANTSSALTKQ